MLPRRTRPDLAWRVRVYSDPVQHAAIAALVVAALAARVGRRVAATAVTAALVSEGDHAVAARSIRPRDTTALAQRPRSPSLLAGAGAGAVVSAAAGPVYGWAVFAALGSHLLHDAGDRAAPTPVLWPWRPARQLGRRGPLGVAPRASAGPAGAAGRHPGAHHGLSGDRPRRSTRATCRRCRCRWR